MAEPQTLPGIWSTPQPQPSTMGLLGVDEDELRRAQMVNWLGAMGAGLLGGRNWGQGLAAGTQMAMQGATQAREGLMRDAALRRELAKQQREEEERQRQLDAITKAAEGLPADQRDFALAFPDVYAKSKAAELFPDPEDAAKLKAQEQLFGLLGGDGGPLPSDMIQTEVLDGPRPYRAKLAGFESASGTMLDNPQSSAAGRYQFMPDTWQDLGLDINTIKDPKVQEEALTKFLGTNATFFKTTFGRAPTDAEQYAMHRFGPEGAAKLYGADPNVPIEQIIGDEAAVVNPDVRGKTAGQVVRLMQQRMGTGSSWQTGMPAAQAASAEPPQGEGTIDLNNLTEAQAAQLNMLATQAGLGSPFKAASGGDDTEFEVWQKQFIKDHGREPTAEEIAGRSRQGESRGFTQAKGLREEFNKLTKDFRDTSVAYQKIESAAKNPSAAGDLSLIFGYMKLLDPGSTVREGEFATAQNAAGIPEQIRNIYNRIKSGERLSPDQRADFTGQAKNVFSVYQRQYDAIKQQYTDLAKRQQVAPEDVIIEGGVPTDGPPLAPPEVGKVEDGYKFLGGNPADPNAWEKVQ